MIFDDESYGGYVCMHGYCSDNCPQCDEYIESRGGIDKCMNCGKYMHGDQLNKDQVCKIPCRNPNEFQEILKMSDSHYSFPREKTLKFFGKRTGWYGENCWKQEGLKFIKRLVNRSNRRWENKQLTKELENLNE